MAAISRQMDSPLALSTDAPEGVGARDARARELVADWFDFVWRTLRRMGVPEANADDAAQQVFWVATRKIGDVPRAGERRFLLAIALRVASEVRRMLRRHPVAEPSTEAADLSPGADELLDQRRARAVIDAVLASMPAKMRVVFVLFELEEMTTPQIAEALGVSHGTVASRLRRSRELFDRSIRRWKARGGMR